jgi:hypothetical protein
LTASGALAVGACASKSDEVPKDRAAPHVVVAKVATRDVEHPRKATHA